MSNYRENFKDVNDNYELMPEGKYEVTVVNAEVKPSKNGNLTWYLYLEIRDRKYVGKELLFMVGMSEKAASIRKGTMTALGVDTGANKAYDLIEDVKGRRALAEVIHESFASNKTGEMLKSAKVKRLRTLSASEPDSLPDLGENIPF